VSEPGRVVRAGKALVVATGDGTLEIGEVQLAGKKRMASADFLRGYSLPEGVMLGE
jgi:methionyl-tRNA formyltransferase